MIYVECVVCVCMCNDTLCCNTMYYYKPVTCKKVENPSLGAALRIRLYASSYNTEKQEERNKTKTRIPKRVRYYITI